MKLPIAYRKRRYLSYSTLVAFHRCPRRYLLDSGYGLASPTQHPALLFGSAIHQAIACWHKAFKVSDAMEGFDSVWNEDLADDKGRCQARGYAHIQNYCATHLPGSSFYSLVKPPEDKGFLKLPGSLSPFEVAFTLDVGLKNADGETIPMVGKIDALGQQRGTGEMVVMEWKTAGQTGPMLLSAFNLSNQVFLYRAAAAAHGLPISRAFVEIIFTGKSKEETTLKVVECYDHLVDETIRWCQKWGKILLATEDAYLKNGEHVEVFEKDFAGCHPYSLFGMSGFGCNHTMMCGCREEEIKNILPLYAVKEERAFPIGDQR